MSYPMLPAHRPQLSKSDALQMLKQFDTEKYPVKLLGIRGYFKKTMGEPSRNDFGLYDDAICIVSPTVFEAFNANTDPSRQTPDLAVLKAPQMVLYKRGIHKFSTATQAQLNEMLRTGKDIPGLRAHWALRQFSNVTTLKHGVINTDNPDHKRWINVHRGGTTTTSSAGCQTIPPTEYSLYYDDCLMPQLHLHKQSIVPYCLVEA